MQDHDTIVVFRHFESSIDASIAKTKLDAYGLPCFLTEENITNLYPGQSILSFKVRLHIFSHDKERAEQILQDDPIVNEGEPTLRCPKCQSSRIDRSFPRRLRDSLKITLFGVLFPDEKINHCLDCDNEF